MLDAEVLTADGNDLPVSRISKESSQQMPSDKSGCPGEEGSAMRWSLRRDRIPSKLNFSPERRPFSLSAVGASAYLVSSATALRSIVATAIAFF